MNPSTQTDHEVQIAPPDETGRKLWAMIISIAEQLNGDWTLVGGLMVQLHSVCAARENDDFAWRVAPPRRSEFQSTSQQLRDNRTGSVGGAPWVGWRSGRESTAHRPATVLPTPAANCETTTQSDLAFRLSELTPEAVSHELRREGPQPRPPRSRLSRGPSPAYEYRCCVTLRKGSTLVNLPVWGSYYRLSRYSNPVSGSTQGPAARSHR